MICHNCGSEVIDGSAVCGYCGAALAPAYQGTGQPEPYDGNLQWGVEQYGYGGQSQAGYDTGYAPQPTIGYDAQPYEAAQFPQPYDAAQPHEAVQFSQPYDAAQPYDASYGGQPLDYGSQPMAYGAGYDVQPPQAYTTAQSPQTYAAAQPTQTPKRGKTGLIVGIIVAAVIVLGGVGVGGYFVYQNMAGDAQAAREPSGNGSGNDPAAASDAAADDPAAADSGSEPAPPSGADTSSRIDPNTLIADFQNPYVILDEEDIKITIDVGSGEGGDSEYFYKVRCVVENKTDREYGITLRDASASNQVGDYLFATLSKSRIDGNPAHNRSMNFLPGGNLAHFELSKDDFEGSITDFKAKLFLSEVESRNVISEYMISAPAM